MSEKSSGKDKALQTAMKSIETQFGQGSIMKLGDAGPVEGVSVIPTGCIALDLALGVGGVPRGRVVEIFGPEGSGKTTLALHIVAEAQKEGNAAFVDAEHALDPVYAQALGVDVENLLVSQPDTGEQALEITEKLVRSGALDVVAIDSVAALVPRAEIEGEMGDAHVGLQARLMSQALRKLAGAISKSKTTAIFINQLRMKIGVMFGNPETTPGGRALKFYSTVRMDIRSRGKISEGDKDIGRKVRVKVVKNKVAPPFRTAEFEIMYGRGISKEGALLNVATDMGIAERAGSWYSYGEEKLGQGRSAAKAYLAEHPKVAAEIEKKVKKQAREEGLPIEVGASEEEEEEEKEKETK